MTNDNQPAKDAYMRGLTLRLPEISQPLDFELQCLGHVTCGPQWGLTEQPSFHRIYYVYGGQAWCHIDGETMPLVEGHLYLFPINRTYTLSHNPDRPLRCTFLHVHTLPLIVSGVKSIEIEGDSLLYQALTMIKALISEGTEEVRYLQSAVLMTLLAKEMTLDFMSDQVIIDVLALIRDRYHEKLDNEVLAKASGYNTNYFIRRFTQAMGVTPGVYLSSYRLRMAIGHILAGMPIGEVASKVGYEDTKAFARFFKKQTGVAPSAYEKYYKLTY